MRLSANKEKPVGCWQVYVRVFWLFSKWRIRKRLGWQTGENTELQKIPWDECTYTTGMRLHIADKLYIFRWNDSDFLKTTSDHAVKSWSLENISLQKVIHEL